MLLIPLLRTCLSVNDEGHHEDSLHAILDHKFDKSAVKNGYVYDRQGHNQLKKTTRGVHLLIAIRDGIDPKIKEANITQQWMPLRIVKESHPVEVAEYAVAHQIDDTPAFKWWVHHALRQRDRITASVRA